MLKVAEPVGDAGVSFSVRVRFEGGLTHFTVFTFLTDVVLTTLISLSCFEGGSTSFTVLIILTELVLTVLKFLTKLDRIVLTFLTVLVCTLLISLMLRRWLDPFTAIMY